MGGIGEAHNAGVAHGGSELRRSDWQSALNVQAAAGGIRDGAEGRRFFFRRGEASAAVAVGTVRWAESWEDHLCSFFVSGS